MSDWAEVELGEVLTLQRGFDLPKRARNPGPYPVVSSSGITGSHDEFKVNPPGVVIGRYGSLGSVHWVTEPFWPLNTGLWVKDFKGNDPRFVSFLLETVAIDGSAAAAVPGVNRNHLHKLIVRLPGLATQHRIAAVLSAIDELIEVNERRIDELEALVYLYFQHMVGRPSKLANGDVENATGDLNELPAGWRWCDLGEVCCFRYGKSLPKARRRPGNVAVVSSAGIIDAHDTAVSNGPGLVVGRKGNVGSIWWAEDAFWPIDTTYYVQSDLPLEFLYWTLQGAEFVDSHAAVPGLSRDQAMAVSVVVPNREIMTKIASFHRKSFRAIAAYRKVNNAAKVTRDLLLPRLISGQLDILGIDLGILTPTESE